MLGCALDPLCEIDVFVFAGNGDFDAYAAPAAPYRKGADDATVLAAVQRLQELYAEVGRREGRLAELGAKKLTRQMADQHPDMRPSSRCSASATSCSATPSTVPLAAEVAVKTIKRSRKTGIVMGFDTQSSRKDAIPPELVELVSRERLLLRQDLASNDGFLGDGSFRRASARPSCAPAATEEPRWSPVSATRSSSCCAGTSSRSTTTAAMTPQPT